MIYIDSKTQSLSYYNKNKLIKTYAISTAKNGLGEKENSGCTPRGWHEIKEKFGDGAAKNSIFISRRFTGECWSSQTHANKPSDDFILSRILWLSGLEQGRNLGDDVDTYNRYIYIHGTAQEHLLGCAVSKGCIRMRNIDIIELFDLVEIGTKVIIE